MKNDAAADRTGDRTGRGARAWSPLPEVESAASGTVQSTETLCDRLFVAIRPSPYARFLGKRAPPTGRVGWHVLVLSPERL